MRKAAARAAAYGLVRLRLRKEAPARQPSLAGFLGLPSRSSPILKVNPMLCQLGERRLVGLG